MDKNILVIGNGFDLYHELRTGYYDFVKYAEDSEYKDNIFIKHFRKVIHENDGWIDCEDEIEYLVSIFQKFLCLPFVNNIRMIQDTSNFSRSEIKILEYLEFIFLKGDRYYMHSDAPNVRGCINKRWFIEKVRKNLDELIKAFRIYLNEVVTLENVKTRSKQLLDFKFDYVVNFNYTDTYKLYGVDDSSVFYVHGSIKSDNMVLGIKDSNDDDLDFVYFKKYFQNIQKRTGLLDRTKFAHSDIPKVLSDGSFSYNSTVIYFFGHSLSNTDGYIIKDIEVLAGKIVIYFYNQEDYESKVVNIISVFGKKRALELLDCKKITFEELENGIEYSGLNTFLG
ncbi:AbiH family protein [Lacrimispora xylanolytica]|uniref:AbiH family protein n=1 Tax=Lacrimispora xylanolytica TaxID=29375 RepID=A0ABY7A899_9FIRM|nr:AbiH family protein [Lacrimispora xylanolytica]WAJ22890.1 AbiH family protein [Lacrimispora xylanolytica]